MQRRPSVFHYLDYREFLNDYLDHLKSKNRRQSQRELTRIAGFGSPSYLTEVLNGSKRITDKMIPRFQKILNLDPKELDYFRRLIEFSDASDSLAKQDAYRGLLQAGTEKALKVLDANEYTYLSNWYVPAIRELILQPDFKEEVDWIQTKLRFHVSAREVKKALRVLEDLNLIYRDKDQKLKVTDNLVSTEAEVSSLAVRQYHRRVLKLAVEALETVNVKERDVSSLSLGLTADQIPIFKKEIQKIRRKLLKLSSKDGDQRNDAIYHFNIQFYPITRKNET